MFASGYLFFAVEAVDPLLIFRIFLVAFRGHIVVCGAVVFLAVALAACACLVRKAVVKIHCARYDMLHLHAIARQEFLDSDRLPAIHADVSGLLPHAVFLDTAP